MPSRRDLIKLGAIAALPASAATPPIDLENITLADIQSGSYSSQVLTQACLARVDQIDRHGPALHAVIETNPDALKVAADLDHERKSKGPRSPLHGVPVLIKDNIDIAGPMLSTAGSMALIDKPAPRDAPLVARLRAA